MRETNDTSSKTSASDFERFLRELSEGKTDGSHERYQQWPVATYRTCNTLANLNVAEMSVAERAWDSATTAVNVTTSITTEFCRGLCRAAHSTVNLAMQSIVYVTGGGATADAQIQVPAPPVSESSIFENPDFYLFLLTSPAVSQSLKQGGAGFLTKVSGQWIDRLCGSQFSNMGQFAHAGALLQKNAQRLFPGIQDHTGLFQNLVDDTISFLRDKCDLSYEDKKYLARDIANLLGPWLSVRQSLSMGEKTILLLSFAQTYGILDSIVMKNSGTIAKIACDIWAQKTQQTELIGFDQKAVRALEPVIRLVLKEGFKENSFTETCDFVVTLVDMLTMEKSNVLTPGLVQLTEKIFAITSKNEVIRHQFASVGKSSLTPESEGLREFFRGFFVNLFRKNGLQVRLQNQIKILNEQQNQAVDYLSNFAGTAPSIADVKNTISEQKKTLEEALSAIQNPEINEHEVYSLAMLELMERKSELEQKKEGDTGSENIERQYRHAEVQLQSFVKNYHMEDRFHVYEETLRSGRQSINDLKTKVQGEINRTDPASVYAKIDTLIIQGRHKVDEMFTRCDLMDIRHCYLSSFHPRFQERLRATAEKNGLQEKDLQFLIENPDIQNQFYHAKMINNKPRDKIKRIDLDKLRSQKEEKKVVEKLERRMRQHDSWIMRLLVRILSGIYLPNWMRRGQMDTIARSIKIYIALNPKDQSDTMRILKSLEMIINFNPEFWRNLMSEQGEAIKNLVNYAIADSHGDYVRTRPEHMEGCIKNIFDYVIRNAINNEKTYQPVNLLLSVWADPSSFDKRYQELSLQHRQQRESVAKHVGKRIAKIIGILREWVSSTPSKHETYNNRGSKK